MSYRVLIQNDRVRESNFFLGNLKMGVDEKVKKGILVSTKKDSSY